MEDLSLIPVTPDLKRAFARSRDAFGKALGLGLLCGWPQFLEALDPQGPDLVPPWGGYLFVVAGEVVGNGGFAGPSDGKRRSFHPERFERNGRGVPPPLLR